MSHGQCWLWNDYLVFSHSIGDVLIWLAYTLIPILAATIYVRGKLYNYSLAYPNLWKWGAAFVFSCSLTHLCGVAEVWMGGWVYYLSSIIKLSTAIVSIKFAYELYRLREELIFISRAVFEIMETRGDEQ